MSAIPSANASSVSVASPVVDRSGGVRILVAVDEEETHRLIAARGQQASEQERAIPAYHEREAALLEDPHDRIAHARDHRREAAGVDQVGGRVAPRRRLGQPYVSVVEDVDALRERLDEPGSAENGGGTSDPVELARRVRRDADQSDRIHPSTIRWSGSQRTRSGRDDVPGTSNEREGGQIGLPPSSC